MHGKYFFLAFVVLIAVLSPAAGSLTKINPGAPVYPGEQNLDISSGLQGCHALAWWPEGADKNSPPAKNVTVIKTLEDSNIAFSYSIDPVIYSGYPGTWYCEDKKPLRAVFEVVRPEISVRFWDLDTGTDITGKTVHQKTNITYRIETTLDRALQYKNRPEITPHDSFYTATLTDQRGNKLLSLYTGSFGKPDTQVISFDSGPYVSISPYISTQTAKWDPTSRNAQGDYLYPPGTYTVTVKQNLNHMETPYTNLSADERAGLLEASASVTFTKPESAPATAVTTRSTGAAGTVETAPPVTSPTKTPAAAVSPTRTQVPAKTTYAPLPTWSVFAALGLASLALIRKRE